MSERSRVLVVDDEPSLREVLSVGLRRANFDVQLAATCGEAMAKLDQEFDLVLTDLQLPDGDGIQILRQVKATSPGVPVILLTAHGSTDTAVAAMRLGAHDYLTKPFDIDELRIRVQQAIEGGRLRRENQVLRAEKALRSGIDGLIGTSPAVRAMADRIRAVAPSSATVLIVGESGTGKELAARALHALSHRKNHPFVAVNCGALTESLLESELFGHVKGAFTDAHGARAGLIEQAHQGTLFLDEIGEMSLAMQVKFLRVLQERVVRRIGSSEETPVDVRVVAATHRDVAQQVRDGRFREDLYYRINVIPLHTPALREHPEDIPLLVSAFTARFAQGASQPVRQFSAAALQRLIRHPWPGNVRELENMVERALTLDPAPVVSDQSLLLDPVQSREEDRFSIGPGFSLPTLLERVQADLVAKALDMAQGKRAEAARLLGITERALRYLVKKTPDKDL
jgi:DNA-binding NtrC family response regulator